MNQLRRYLLPITLLAVGVAIAGNVLVGSQNHSDQVATCRQVEALKTVVRQVIKQGEDALGKPGSAGYAYYQAHPQELASARRQADGELAEFGPRHC